MRSLKITSVAVALLAGSAAAQVESQWNFDGDLDAAFGSGILDYWTTDAQSQTTFGTTGSFGIANTPDGGNAACALVEFSTDLEAFVCIPGFGPNGGGAYTNDYTMIWDIFVPQSSWDNADWLSIYNTNATNSNDGDMFIWMGAEPGEFGVGALGYAGEPRPGKWHRYAITFKTLDDGTVKHSKFIDGTLVGIGETTRDGRFALYNDDFPDSPWFHVIADESGDLAPCYIASFYVADYAWDASEIRALGCVAAGGATTPGPNCSDQPSFCDTPADFNGDGVVDTRDVLAFLNTWVQGCP